MTLTTVLSASLLAVLMTSSHVTAQDQGCPNWTKLRPRLDTMFSTIDSNTDKALSAKEVGQYLKKFDSDLDHSCITKEEYVKVLQRDFHIEEFISDGFWTSMAAFDGGFKCLTDDRVGIGYDRRSYVAIHMFRAALACYEIKSLECQCKALKKECTEDDFINKTFQCKIVKDMLKFVR